MTENRRTPSGRSGSTLPMPNRLAWAFALAVAAGIFMAPGVQADHKPNHGGGGGGGDDSGGPPAFGRADFVKAGEPGVSTEFNIVDDGGPFCSADDHPLGGVWDYWDQDDPETCEPAAGVPQSDFDTGGRWIFNTGSAGSRYLTFLWQPVAGFENPDLDAVLHPDIADPAAEIDNLRIRLNADRLFKEGFDRQPTKLEIWNGNPLEEGYPGRTHGLTYQEDLYILRDPADPNIVCLTTEGDGSSVQPDVRRAELTDDRIKGNKPGKLIGIYDMPMTLIVRRVAATQ